MMRWTGRCGEVSGHTATHPGLRHKVIGLRVSGMSESALSAFVQVPHFHFTGMAFCGQCRLVYGGIFCLVKVIRLDIATQKEASGGEIMDNGAVTHNVNQVQ